LKESSGITAKSKLLRKSDAVIFFLVNFRQDSTLQIDVKVIWDVIFLGGGVLSHWIFA